MKAGQHARCMGEELLLLLCIVETAPVRDHDQRAGVRIKSLNRVTTEGTHHWVGHQRSVLEWAALGQLGASACSAPAGRTSAVAVPAHGRGTFRRFARARSIIFPTPPPSTLRDADMANPRICSPVIAGGMDRALASVTNSINTGPGSASPRSSVDRTSAGSSTRIDGMPAPAGNAANYVGSWSVSKSGIPSTIISSLTMPSDALLNSTIFTGSRCSRTV